MNEELKIIMETLAQMGETGKDAFVAYLLIVYGTMIAKHFLWAGVFFTGMLILYKSIIKAIAKAK